MERKPKKDGIVVFGATMTELTGRFNEEKYPGQKMLSPFFNDYMTVMREIGIVKFFLDRYPGVLDIATVDELKTLEDSFKGEVIKHIDAEDVQRFKDDLHVRIEKFSTP